MFWKKDKLEGEKKYALKISLLFGVIFIIFGIVLFLGASKYTVISYYGASIYKLLPFSAAKIDGKSINLGEFNENYKAVEKFYKEGDFTSVGVEIDFEGNDGEFYKLNIKRKILDKMINNYIAMKLLESEYDVKIEESKIKSDFKKVVVDHGVAETAESELNRLYGWDLDDFRDKIAKPQIYEEELQKRVLNDEENEINLMAREKAKRALNRIKSGEDFSMVAKEVSEGQSSSSGGDLGYFKEGVMVPEFDEVAFALQEGEVSDIVRTRYGYHIIKVEEVNDDEIKARHILFRIQEYQDWFKEKKYLKKIEILIEGLYYNKEEGRVMFKDDNYNQKIND